jgi:GcrA cell cycle regulator
MTVDNRRKITDEQIMTAASMWKDGEKMGSIAEKLGLNFSNVRFITGSRRHLFPYRKNNSRRANPIIPKIEEAVELEAPVRPGCVTRVTTDGAKITLPRITFIDGPEPKGRRI